MDFLIIVSAVATLVIVAVAWLCIYSRVIDARALDQFLHLNDRQPVPFDQERWKLANPRTTEEWHGLRHKMVNDLLKRHTLVGMSQSDIIALLGPFQCGGCNAYVPGYMLNHSVPGGEMWLKIFVEETLVTKYAIENFDV